MRIPTVTIDRDGSPVVINQKDFVAGRDVLWGESAPEQDATDEKDRLIAQLAQLGIKKDRRVSVEKLSELLAQATA